MLTKFTKYLLATAIACLALASCGGSGSAAAGGASSSSGSSTGSGTNSDSSTGSTIITPKFSISGSVTGLSAGQQLTLLNNGSDPQTITADSDFTFDTFLNEGASYSVTVSTQPSGQFCSVSNGSGNYLSVNVTNVAVTCASTSFTVSVNVTGLNPGAQLVLQNNASNSTAITSNGVFTFSQPVASGAAYAVTAPSSPIAQTCTIANGSAAAISTNVTDVAVSCQDSTLTVLYSFSSPGLQVNEPLLTGPNGVLYGLNQTGGANGYGFVFSYNLATSTYSDLYDLTSASLGPSPYMALGTDGMFYGTTREGGTDGYGTIFMFNPNTNAFSTIFSFTPISSNQDYGSPTTGLTLGANGHLYGGTVTNLSGIPGTDVIFEFDPVSQTMVSTTTISSVSSIANLSLGTDGNLYGTAILASENQVGIAPGYIIQYNPNSKAANTLYSFPYGLNIPQGAATSPSSSLVQDAAGNLYGTTTYDGAYGAGTIYRYNTTSNSLTILYSFAGGQMASGNMILGSDGNLYGTVESGNDGGIFMFDLSSQQFSMLHTCTDSATDCGSPDSLTIGPDGHFYGTSVFGGANNQGTIFRF